MIAIIVAMAENRVIGKANALPWDLPEDLKHFRETTSGNTVIMGRKTYESIGRPLPNRNNIVLSRILEDEKVDVCTDIREALKKAESYGKDIYVIGGESVYRHLMPFADKMIISHVKREVEGDSYFPEFDEDEWVEEDRKSYEEFDIVTYVRENADNN